MADKTLLTTLKLDNQSFLKNLTDTEKSIVKFSTAIIGVGIAALAAAKLTADYQDKMIKTARAAGSTAENFSAMAHAAEMSGVSIEQLSSAYGAVNAANYETIKGLQKFGVSLTDVNGRVKSGDDAMLSIADRMQSLKSPAEKSALAIAAFGSSGTGMVTMLKDGSQGLANMKKEAELLGIVVSTKAGKAAEKFNSDWALTKLTVKGLTNTLGESLIAWMNQGTIMDTVREAIQSITKFWKSLDADTKNLVITIGVLTAAFVLLVAVVSIFTGGFGLIAVAVSVAIAAVVSFAVYVWKHWSKLSDVLKPVISVLKSFGAEVKKGFGKVVKFVKELYQKFTGLSKSGTKVTEKFSEMGEVAGVVLKMLATGVIVATVPFQIMFDVISGVINAISLLGKAASLAFSGKFKEAGKTAKDAMKEISLIGKNVSARLADAKKKIIETWAKKVEITIDPKKPNKKPNNTPNPDNTRTNIAPVPYTHELTDSIKKMNEVIASHRKNIGYIATAYADVFAASTKIVQSFTAQFLTLANNIASRTQYAASVAIRNFEVLTNKTKELFDQQRKDAENFENEKIKKIEENFDNEINLLKNAEDTKIAIMEKAKNNRLLLMDEEYQAAAAKREEEFQIFLGKERENYELEKEFLLGKSIDKEQRMLNAEMLEADFVSYIAQLNKKHEQDMLDSQKLYLDGKKNTEKKFDDDEKINKIKNDDEIKALELLRDTALEQATVDKNTKLANLDKMRSEQEREESKNRLRIQYDAEVKTFRQTQAARIADTMVNGLASAAQAFSSLSRLGFVGMAAGAVLAGLIMSNTTLAINNIQSQKPIKPAGLLAEGGYIGGNRPHSRGGLSAEVESGEFVIDKHRTEKLYSAIENQSAGGVQIIFSQGSINAQNLDNEAAARLVSNIIAQRLRREGVIG